MNTLIKQFANYLDVERKFSPRTIKAYQHDLGKFANYLVATGKTEVAQISKQDIRGFIDVMAKGGFRKPNSAITLARKLSSIKSFFKYLVREGVLVVNPALDIGTPKIPETEPSYLAQDEYLQLINSIRALSTPYYHFRDVAIATLFLGTGIRLSELVGLNIESINFQTQKIKVRGKGNKERLVPMHDDVIIALRKYLQSRPEINSNCLFVSRKGGRLSSDSVYHLIKRSLEQAGLSKDKLTVHSLRHTFAVSLLDQGVNLVVIQGLLGHKKLETTRRYLHINDIDMRNAVDKLTLSKRV